MPALEDHPLSCIFPLMPDGELDSLAADIEANGLRDPVWLFEGKILDGRNRYRACVKNGMDARTETYRGKEPLGFVISKNLHRRHLTEGQRAMVAIEIANLAPGTNQHENKGKVDSSREPSTPVSQSQAADSVGVSLASVKRAAKVVQDAPELAEAVKSGALDVSTAAKVAKLPAAARKKVAAAEDPKAEAKKQIAKAKPKAESPGETSPDQPKAEPAVVPPTQVDGWDIPIQPHAAEAFAAVPKFKELVNAIQAAAKLFNELASLPGGKFLTLPDVSSYRRGKKTGDGEYADRFVHEGLERAFHDVKRCVPTHTVCPYHYVEAAHPADCRTCLNLNWTPVLSTAIPKVAIERAKESLCAKETA